MEFNLYRSIAAVEDLAAEQSRAAQLQRDLDSAREELVVARAAAAAAERSDLPFQIAALEAEGRRLTDLTRQGVDSLAHEREMRQAAEEEAEAARAENGGAVPVESSLPVA